MIKDLLPHDFVRESSLAEAQLVSVRKLTNETVQGGPYRWYATDTGPCTVGCAVATVQHGTVVWYYTN
jgi:hypothetical protein